MSTLSAFIEKTPQRTKHVLHMFCERTVINRRHVACQRRGPAFSRGQPPPTRTAACSCALPLASDAVACFLLVVTEHTQFCVAGIGINLFFGTPREGQERGIGTSWNARTSSCLVIPTLLFLQKQARAQKTTFVYLARGLYFWAYWDFARLKNFVLVFIVVFFVFVFLISCLCIFVRGRFCICFFWYGLIEYAVNVSCDLATTGPSCSVNRSSPAVCGRKK